MHVLVVDDDDICLRALTLMLKKHGATLHKAKCARDAKELTQQQDFDLIFTDIGLPDVEGFELVEYFSKLESSTPIVVVSGHILEEAAATLKAMGVVALLEKPIYANQIHEIVEQIKAEAA